MICCFGGCDYETNDPFSTPYLGEYLVALVFLLAAVSLWRRIRPAPKPLLRILVGTAALLAFAVMVDEVSVHHHPAARKAQLRFVLESCTFVGALLLVEVVYMLRHPRSIARALRRRRAGPAVYPARLSRE